MSFDFDALLNRSWEEVPEPQLIPDGAWLNEGKNVALVKPREEGQSLKVLFSYKAKQPVEVAQDLLDEMGDYDFSINELTYTIYIETAADWDKVRKHLALHGLEMTGDILDGNGKLGFAKKFRGSQVVAQVGSRSYEDSNQTTVWQNTLSKFQAVEE